MDAVNAFNTELFSMIDLKPPISRAKMMSVTKSAIKAIKLYKHVVQIVEKFIKKCKPELKVPGLYVVDSIVRQSRHQFGVDKDVFGPRFLKNFTDTFQNLYHCPEDDKSKILRVLNLWQKNGVFDMDIIQPLMDMANGVTITPPALEVPSHLEIPPTVPSAAEPVASQLPSSDALAAVAQLFQSPHGQELQRMLQNFQQTDKTLATIFANNMSNQSEMPVPQHSSHSEKKSSLAEKLLDRFDYDDEPEDVTTKDGSYQHLGIPENVHSQFPGHLSQNAQMMRQSHAEHVGAFSRGEHHKLSDGRPGDEAYSQFQVNSREVSNARGDGRHRGHSWRSRSGSRSPRRRRSRSSSRSRRSRHRRSRSRESRWRSRSHSQDKNEREKDRERRQRGLPIVKPQTLSVCSTTLWVGQLDKKTQQSDVMSLLEEFGQISSINMIPPRGCAYIVMVHRQDANTALNKLSRGSYKVNQKPMKIAWALNKGIKSVHKKFWDVERGVTYIPWAKVKVEELDTYREGGMLDEESLNPAWNRSKDPSQQALGNGALESIPVDGTITAHMQMPPADQAAPIKSPPGFHSPIMMSPTSLHPGVHPELTQVMPGSDPQENSKEDPPPDQSMLLHPTDHEGIPRMGLPGPGPMHGPRPGMPPMQHPAGMPNPHLNPYLHPPNMPHMPPGMVPGGPVFPPDRLRMPMPFPHRGPPFHRHPAMGPEIMDDRDGPPFQNGRPGFGYPAFPRGRW